MQRSLITELENWKKSPTRKPLVLMGARQVGKTYLLKAFAQQNYQNFVYLNFDREKTLNSLFENNLSPQKIIQTLAIETGQRITPETTLIILDEVQECPNALNSLKYFHEDANEYHICAAGSLLGVKLLNAKGFPVGKVKILYLYPLDFCEFLLAKQENDLFTLINQISIQQKIPELLHEKLLHLFKLYMITGGMPEAIVSFFANDQKDFNTVRDVQYNILQTYSLDFAKHSPPDQIIKIAQVWDSIPSQLSKENKKYIYSVIRKGARAQEFEKAIQRLVEAELVCKIYNISVPKLPLTAYSNFDIFKLYMFDVGLYGAVANLDPRIILQQNQLFQEFKGSYVEAYVAQVLHKQRTTATSSHGNYYWTSAGKAEVDFVIQYQDKLLPLEVKSGESNKKRSLQVYAEKYKPELLLRTSPQNLRLDGKILNIPLYLLPKLQQLVDTMEAL